MSENVTAPSHLKYTNHQVCILAPEEEEIKPRAKGFPWERYPDIVSFMIKKRGSMKEEFSGVKRVKKLWDKIAEAVRAEERFGVIVKSLSGGQCRNKFSDLTFRVAQFNRDMQRVNKRGVPMPRFYNEMLEVLDASRLMAPGPANSIYSTDNEEEADNNYVSPNARPLTVLKPVNTRKRQINHRDGVQDGEGIDVDKFRRCTPVSSKLQVVEGQEGILVAVLNLLIEERENDRQDRRRGREEEMEKDRKREIERREENQREEVRFRVMVQMLQQQQQSLLATVNYQQQRQPVFVHLYNQQYQQQISAQPLADTSQRLNGSIQDLENAS